MESYHSKLYCKHDAFESNDMDALVKLWVMRDDTPLATSEAL